MPEQVNDIHELIRARWSSRSIDPDRPVPFELIDLLLEAARWAPSSGNGQPWRYLVFNKHVPDAHEKARDCLNPANQAWANRAPTLILTVAKEVRDNGRHNSYAQHDVGLSTENLLLQAIALGLHCRPMAGFDHAKAIRYFHIPEGHRPMVMIAIGYPGRVKDLPEDIQEKQARPRTRRLIEEFTFHGDWGSSYTPAS